MLGEMYVIHPEPLLTGAKEVQKGNAWGIELSAKNFGIKQSTTSPPAGYRHPNNFPDCCAFHADVLKRGMEKLDTFPDCCAGHRNLHKVSWFNKSEYLYLPFKLVATLSYTQHIIAEYLFHPNWYKETTDYISYTISSYGQFPDGYGSPLGLSQYIEDLAEFIRQQDLLPDYKKERLLHFLHAKPVEPGEKTDINLLIRSYQEWVELFPFDLPLFRHLKPHFKKRLPILKGPGQTNHYSGLTCFQMKTRQELKEFLLTLTRFMLKEINSLQLFEQGHLLQPDRLRLDIILAHRKIQLQEDEATNVSGKEEYIKLLSKWLKEEKEFLVDIREYVNQNDPVRFISDLLDGFRTLQKNSSNEYCIRNVRNDGPDKESEIRYWFRNFFAARYPDAIVTVEEQQGKGHMDLRIVTIGSPDKIVEFKGWWNSHKANTAAQICNYLTDFEKDGYVVMINHLKTTPIVDGYKAIITNPAMNYIPNSWVAHQFGQTDVYFYQSKHRFDGKEKTLYHFLLNVYF
jgi:hypothetical protein